MDDAHLIRAFAQHGDEQAFAELVRRYVDLVYAAARRQVRDAHLAEDVTQAVFIMLARKAGEVRPDALAGWLVKSARLAAKAATRAEVRRRRRETVAAQVNAATTDPMRNVTGLTKIQLLSGELDEALSRLSETDRTAITLRYLQGLRLTEVAARMHSTPAAVAQRIGRALGKMRTRLGRRGIDLRMVVLARLMKEQSRFGSPPHVTSAAASASRATPAARSSAAQRIAEIALQHLRNTRVLSAAATVLLLLTLLGSFTTAAAQWLGPHGAATPALGHSPALASAPSPTSPVVHPAIGKLKVGVYLSLRSALLTLCPNQPPLGINNQTRHLAELKTPDIDLFPVVEPGTAADPLLVPKIRFHFPGKPALDVTDAVALRGLDAIVVCRGHAVPAAAVSAIESAVRGGTGLVIREGFGSAEPGYTPQVLALLGLRDGTYVLEADGLTCETAEVIARHPILDPLAPGMKMLIRPNGPYGHLTREFASQPLMRVNGEIQFHDRMGEAVSTSDAAEFRPIYVSGLGAGRIVVFAFTAYADTPPELSQISQRRLTARAVRWTAGRAVDLP